MQNILIKIVLKFITPEKIGKLVAGAIAKLLNHAKENNYETWDKSKAIVKQIKKWSDLFLQVYNDDTLTSEEEQIIATEIANMTDATSIEKLLKDIFNGKKQTK